MKSEDMRGMPREPFRCPRVLEDNLFVTPCLKDGPLVFVLTDQCSSIARNLLFGKTPWHWLRNALRCWPVIRDKNILHRRLPIIAYSTALQLQSIRDSPATSPFAYDDCLPISAISTPLVIGCPTE